MVAAVAHCPAFGVKVYSWVPTVAVAIVAGDQVPINPLVEVAGKLAGMAFWHYGTTAVKVGVTGAVTVTFIVVVVAHWPALGVKV